MWPTTALIIAASLTAVSLQWRSIGSMFRSLFSRRAGSDRPDVSLRTTILGVAVLATILAFVQNVYFGMSYLETFAAVVIELPLMLIGVRVLGATNFGPVSVTANSLQVIFAAIWPQNIAHNLAASGIAGDGNPQTEGTMQDFRTGQRVGSTPRLLTYVELRHPHRGRGRGHHVPAAGEPLRHRPHHPNGTEDGQHGGVPDEGPLGAARRHSGSARSCPAS